jgi:hypothetical protein
MHIEVVTNATCEFIDENGKQAYALAGVPTKVPASVHAQLVAMGAIKATPAPRVDDPWAAEVRAVATKPFKKSR